jgi:UDP-N-acetylglucosamine 2-epimerase (non-hydrolysing)
MRYETERMEGVAVGFAQLVGADEDKILSAVSDILDKDKSETRKDGRKNPYGDGTAAIKIQECIDAYFEKN